MYWFNAFCSLHNFVYVLMTKIGQNVIQNVRFRCGEIQRWVSNDNDLLKSFQKSVDGWGYSSRSVVITQAPPKGAMNSTLFIRLSVIQFSWDRLVTFFQIFYMNLGFSKHGGTHFFRKILIVPKRGHF